MSDNDDILNDVEDVDVRSVGVFWRDEEEPVLVLNGCSEYEALGLLTGAVRALRRVATVELEDIDD